MPCVKEKSEMTGVQNKWVRQMLGLLAVFAFTMPAVMVPVTPAIAQVQTIDPNDAIDADLAAPDYDGTLKTSPATGPEQNTGDVYANPAAETDPSMTMDPDIYDQAATEQGSTGTPVADNVPVETTDTYQEDDLIGAAEGVFGKGAKGLAGVIEDILKKQGRPNAYITGREASGAFIVGLRYGSGELHHKVEGNKPVYWTGPSIGFDVGGNAAKSFVLVYNLYDTEELYKRYPAGEGAAYFVGGFHVSYLRSGDKVLIPVRLGAGLRLGANVGYMKFSKKQKWLPF